MHRRYRLLVESRDGTWRVLDDGVNELRQYRIGTGDVATWVSQAEVEDGRDKVQGNDLPD